MKAIVSDLVLCYILFILEAAKPPEPWVMGMP